MWHNKNSHPDIVHKKLLEAIGTDVLGLLVGSVSDIWHQKLSLKFPPHSVINTLGPTPVWLTIKRKYILSFQHLSNTTLHIHKE
jgi:hypothetical protein